MFVDDYELWCSHSRNEKVEPLDMSKATRPRSWVELQQLCNGGGEFREVYDEMRFLLTTSVQGAVPCLDDPLVESFCESYLLGDDEWSVMSRRGVEAASRRRVAESFGHLLDMVRHVRTETVAEELFRPRSRE